MRRRLKLKRMLLLPPVLLAVIFIWLTMAQMRNRELPGSGVTKESNTVLLKSQKTLKLDTDSKISGPFDELNSAHTGNTGSLEIPDTGEDEGKVTLLFCGDIYLSGHVLNAYDRAGGIHGVLDGEIRGQIDSADIFMANEEFPFSDRGTAVSDKQYTFRLPAAHVQVMQEIAPDIVTLANNHALDYGVEALLDTCEVLDNAGIIRVGAGANLDEAKALKVIEAKGKKIGFLAASRVIPDSGWSAGNSRPGMLATYDAGILIGEIQKAKEACDYLVVYVHWGIERNNMPQGYQRTLGKQYIDAGADLVVGSHPHVLQGIEYYNGKPIVYSLGNFVFGSSIPQTALLKVELPSSPEESASFQFLPCTSSAGYTRVLDEAKRPEFYAYMQNISFGAAIDGEGKVSPQ